MDDKAKKAAYRKKWRDANKEHIKEYDRLYREKNKDLLNSKRRKKPSYHRKPNLSRYNLTEETYEEMVRAQNGLCLGCGKHYTSIPRQRLYVDHCHTSGKVRGLLCHNCNSALGLLKENIDTLYNLIFYIKNNTDQ
jgi:hypothetical protein